jgi:hypothetical protein
VEPTSEGDDNTSTLFPAAVATLHRPPPANSKRIQREPHSIFLRSCPTYPPMLAVQKASAAQQSSFSPSHHPRHLLILSNNPPIQNRLSLSLSLETTTSKRPSNPNPDPVFHPLTYPTSPPPNSSPRRFSTSSSTTRSRFRFSVPLPQPKPPPHLLPNPSLRPLNARSS